MKLLLISGSYPPVTCGIGSYTEKLVLALQKFDIKIELLTNVDFSLSQLFHLFKTIDNIGADIIHIQYPSEGFGYGITPQILSLKYKTLVTIHEVSQFHPLRRLLLLPFSMRATLIFTNYMEYEYFRKIFPWHRKQANVIPIGSNIIFDNKQEAPFEKKNITEIVYFGLIRPKKGLENVLDLAHLLQKRNSPYKVKIVGKTFRENSSYFNKIKMTAENLPVTWFLNHTDLEVSEELCKHVMAYLPFPDGASERRGSLLAVLNSGLLTFTTRGIQTPIEMDDAVVFVNDPLQVTLFLEELESHGLKEKVIKKSTEARKFLKNFEWDEIAKKHILLYRKLAN